MKKLGMTLAFAAVSAFGGEMVGYVSETNCGAKHTDGSAGAVSCVTNCIKRGAKPVLVVDGKVVAIANPDKVAASFYGKKVKAMVHSDGAEGPVTIDSIEAAK